MRFAAYLYGVRKPPVYLKVVQPISLVLRPSQLFQCYTQKAGGLCNIEKLGGPGD